MVRDLPRIRRYLMVIARGLLIALGVFFGASYLGKYFIDQLPIKYRATAEIRIVHSASAGSGYSDNAGNSGALDPAAELEIIRSPLVLQPVIDDLGLDRTWAKRVFGVEPRQLAPGEALGYLNKILAVKFQSGTDIIEITATSSVPEEAAAVANTVVDSFKAKRDAEQTQIEEFHDPSKNGVLRQIVAAEAEIDSRRSQMEALRVRLEARGIQINPEAINPTDPDLQNYRNDERDLAERHSRLEALKAQLARSDDETHVPSEVRIIAPAVVPRVASSPNRRLDYLIADLVAILLSVGIASSAEVIFLLLRAAERPES